MTQTATATFDGKSLVPDRPLDLRPNQRYIITVEELPAEAADETAWGVLAALSGGLEAPEDWSAEHDHYLYGTPKLSDG